MAGAGFPMIVSVDDHVVEPPDLWQRWLPDRFREEGPRVRRARGRLSWLGSQTTFTEDEGEGSGWVDLWLYQDMVWPLARGWAQSGYPDENGLLPVTYDDILPGTFRRPERLAEMDANHTSQSLTFPTVSRFCGQTFLERADKETALACVRAYNDWMIREWCADEGYGRLIPLTLIPLWDVGLAVREVERCARLGSHAISFSEQPAALGLPTIYSGYWDPLWRACEETETVVNMHIGSSSQMPMTSPDAPQELPMTLNAENAMHAFADWLISGVFHRFGRLTVALSEGQVGWMPYYLQRLDHMWRTSEMFDNLKAKLPEPPSHYARERIYGCIFDDEVGLRNRDVIGMSQIMFETDFPHSDSTYPDSRRVAQKLCEVAGLDDHETWQLIRGNAIKCYNLARWGITQ